VDDVLNNLTEAWLQKWRLAHPECQITYPELVANPPNAVVGIGRLEYLESLDRIRCSGAESELLSPHPEVLAWMNREGHLHRHMALTARPGHAVAHAASWVMTHFGKWIRTFAFVPIRQPADWPVYEINKAEYLSAMEIRGLLIDDSLHNVNEVLALNSPHLTAWAFPQPWNDSNQSVENILSELSKR
jgi:hypothetical protein